MFFFHHFPISFRINVLPIFRSIPPFVVGIPTLRAMLALKPDIPNNLFQENDIPYLPLNPYLAIV